MNAVTRKAKAGVTLVELLVVILIVTILSVSMLPLLQPFVTEAQYAAEAIPVIGNLRTKIGVYQYEKTKLPQHTQGSTTITAGGTTTTVADPIVETWRYKNNDSTMDVYEKAIFQLRAGMAKDSSGNDTGKSLYVQETVSGSTKIQNLHFGSELDIDQQDLKGKRSRPAHYEYVVLRNGTDYIYAIGVFGDGNGLKLGTGYAVCEINLPSIGRKYVGTWKRYKAIEDTITHFTTNDSSIDDDPKHTPGCCLKEELMSDITAGKTADGKDDGKEPTVISLMRAVGWEF